MALIIKFVDRNNVIRAEFLRFIYIDSGLRGVDVKANILDALRDCDIDMKNCRGQDTMAVEIWPVFIMGVLFL